MSAQSDAIPIDQIADHDRRLTILERSVAEIRAEYRSLSDKLMQMHGENKASAEAREKATLQAIGAVAAKVEKLGDLRGWAKWALVVTGIAFGYASAHFAGWVQ